MTLLACDADSGAVVDLLPLETWRAGYDSKDDGADDSVLRLPVACFKQRREGNGNARLSSTRWWYHSAVVSSLQKHPFSLISILFFSLILLSTSRLLPFFYQQMGMGFCFFEMGDFDGEWFEDFVLGIW